MSRSLTLEQWESIAQIARVYAAVTSRTRHEGEGVITLTLGDTSVYDSLDALLAWFESQRFPAPTILRQRSDLTLRWPVIVPMDLQIVAESQSPRLSPPTLVSPTGAQGAAPLPIPGEGSPPAITIQHRVTDRHFKISYPKDTAIDWHALTVLLREEAGLDSISDPSPDLVVWGSVQNDPRSTATILASIAAIVQRAIIR